MSAKWRTGVLGGLFAAVLGVWLHAANQPGRPDRRTQLYKDHQDGNYNDAYEGLRQLALDPKADRLKVGKDLETALYCLHRLGREDESDAFREAVIAVHRGNWRLLAAAAQSYFDNRHLGRIAAGKFLRGDLGEGGGRFVNAAARDRVRALQLMDQALPLAKADPDRSAVAAFYLRFADHLLTRGEHYEPWRLQYLTDLGKLPDYEDQELDEAGVQGAPVDAKGEPVFHRLPKSYQAAKSDGERWRWLLAEAARLDRGRANAADMRLADFLRDQFDVQTLAHPRDPWAINAGAALRAQAAAHGLPTLGEDETVARLATGVKRFRLPEELNWIRIYRRIAERGRTAWGARARDTLARIFEDRQQLVKAAAAWKQAIAEHGPGKEDYRRKQLEQIVGNWGRFEAHRTQPVGQPATVDYRFRNGKKVAFEAHAVLVPKLLEDSKAYLKSSPARLDQDRYDLAHIGYRLIEQQGQRYLGEKVASWEMDLKPRPAHADDLVTVTTPLKKPGAYLLTARMAGGNISRIVVWLSDTAILKKHLDDRLYYFVADAVTGRPVPGAAVELFGYKAVQVKPNQNEWRVETLTHTSVTDADGQVLVDEKVHPEEHKWVITARKPKDGAGGADRFAYLGFSRVWREREHEAEYNATRVFIMTDRPVYRPGETVRFKVWVRHAKYGHAKYDQPDTSDFAGKTFTLRITGPKLDKLHKRAHVADAYGGFAGTFTLPPGATLGVYYLGVDDDGRGTFRVEEYRKPEFEVKVEAPREPVRLGEKAAATVEARYYFGAPVTRAKVKYKVLRTSYSGEWCPGGAWDWLYGRGYWWFAADSEWYPGWALWGCPRPLPSWMEGGYGLPEVVLENEVEIGPDGKVVVPIDTSAAKQQHGDQDHEYTITAEVVDESRRTIVGTGRVLVARQPFRVVAWLDRGHYRAGDTVEAHFQAQTIDQKPVRGKGELTLYAVSYDAKNEPVEKAVQTWKLDTDAQGSARQQLRAAKPGQYRLSYRLTDANQRTIEGGYLFVVRGEGFDGRDFRFNDLELITDKREYAPGEKVKLLINTNRTGGTVLLFLRPTDGVYLPPKVLRLQGKSAVEEVAVVAKDMPNFFIEAVTVSGGRVHCEIREVVVPPEKRILKVEVLPSRKEYRPGEQAKVKVRLTDLRGKPFVGSTVVSVYDRSVEYIAGGSNVPEIKEHFWKWRRYHTPVGESSLFGWSDNLLRSQETEMSDLGVLGEGAIDRPRAGAFAPIPPEEGGPLLRVKGWPGGAGMMDCPDAQGFPTHHRVKGWPGGAGMMGGGMGFAGGGMMGMGGFGGLPGGGGGFGMVGGQGQVPAPPVVRRSYADTAYWSPSLTTDASGTAEISFKMPDNLTGWKVRVWAMGHGTKVGQGEAEIVTKKDLLVRLQAPRFFVEKDEVVLSANVHNYLTAARDVRVSLALEGGTLTATDQPTRTVRIPSGGERRIDWRVKVLGEGEAVVRVKAVTDGDGDAVEMRFPCRVHGALKVESFSGVLRPDRKSAAFAFAVPGERRVEASSLEVRYSPTLAGAMVDALPYLVDYPYGCTEQTLNRFLPTVITQRVLQSLKLDLKEIAKHQINLNSQEIGKDRERLKGWKRSARNPVFDEAEVQRMVRAGLDALAGMQVSDGGWGWFSGHGERSYPHTTAVVVHGLQVAKTNGVALPEGVLERGVEWLKAHQEHQLQLLRNAPTKSPPYKERADNTDALIYRVLAEAGIDSAEMRDALFRDRTHLAVYAKALLGLALHRQGQGEKLRAVLKNLEQYLQQDDENQTAYLKLPASDHWWNWYGSETEANAHYLQLLARTSPKDVRAARLVKYLLNNRRHATYWGSTRDTAVCVEALAEYLKASGEDRPDMTVEVWLDGKKRREVKIDAANLFRFDNRFLLEGEAVTTGKHVLEIRRRGTGPVYFSAYLTNFTQEDFITRAGLEVRVNRKYYRLTRDDREVKVPGQHGQPLGQRVERYRRTELANLAELKSGDLVEVELEIDSKNDYEYLLFEDPKAAGFEPLAVQSGYTFDGLGTYREVRDEKVCFFVRRLPRGKHSVSYRLRAEIPGRFSALPAQAYAMYAPELRGNSDEIKLRVRD
jgi:alpha-2-macroglobulin